MNAQFEQAENFYRRRFQYDEDFGNF